MSNNRWRDGWVVALCLLLAAGPDPGRAEDEKKPAEALPADLARVPQNALMLLSVNAGGLWEHEAMREVRRKMPREVAEVSGLVEKGLGVGPGEIDRLIVVGTMVQGSEPFLYFIRTKKPYDARKVRATLGDAAEEVEVGKETYLVGQSRRALMILDDRTFVAGRETEVRWLLENPKAGKPGPLGGAVAAAGKHDAVLALNPAAFPPEVKTNAPAELIPFLPLFEAEVGMVTVDVGERVQALLRISFDDGKKAEEAAKPLQTLVGLMPVGLGEIIKQLDKEPEETRDLVALLKDAQTALKDVKVGREGDDLRADASVKADLTFLAPTLTTLTQRVRTAATRMSSQNNLKQMGLALHNYHDLHGALPPPAVFDKEGKPTLSWRVLLLPYLEQDDLYKEFKLDEPWDSPHNIKLLDKMPKVYASPTGQGVKEHKTFYQAVVGKGTIWDGKRGVRFTEVPDGLSNTIMIVEGGKPVPWTKPEDVPFDPDKKPPALTGLYPGGFLALLCDGSVRFISDKVSEPTLRRALLRNDGMPIGPDF